MRVSTQNGRFKSLSGAAARIHLKIWNFFTIDRYQIYLILLLLNWLNCYTFLNDNNELSILNATRLTLYFFAFKHSEHLTVKCTQSETYGCSGAHTRTVQNPQVNCWLKWMELGYIRFKSLLCLFWTVYSTHNSLCWMNHI